MIHEGQDSKKNSRGIFVCKMVKGLTSTVFARLPRHGYATGGWAAIDGTLDFPPDTQAERTLRASADSRLFANSRA